jgi:hypothetical protein
MTCYKSAHRRDGGGADGNDAIDPIGAEAVMTGDATFLFSLDLERRVDNRETSPPLRLCGLQGRDWTKASFIPGPAKKIKAPNPRPDAPFRGFADFRLGITIC